MTIDGIVKEVRPRRAKARGGALIEALLAAIILVPILFGTAMLGKTIDVRQTAVLAGRYALWETTVHGTGVPASDVHERFFAPSVTASAAEPATARSVEGRRDEPDATTGWPFAREPFARAEVVTGRAAAAARADDASREGVAASVGAAIHGGGNLLGGRSGGEWDVEADGLVRGGATVPLEASGWFGASVVRESAVIMNDGWSASGTAQLERRTRSFVPAGALEQVADTLSAVAVVPVLKELGGLEGALGKVDAETLPLTERHALQSYPETSP